MSAENILLELVSALKSNKKKDRVTGIQNVCTLLQHDRILAFLTDCSVGTRKGICWDALFSQVHSAILAEAERGAVSAKQMQEMIQALYDTVGKSCARVKPGTLINAVLSVFESYDASAAVGKIYVDLTLVHLLVDFKYRSEMTARHWNDLVELCRIQYLRPHAGGSSHKFLELLTKTVVNGVHYSLPHATLLNLLPFLQTILLSDLPPSGSFQYNLLQLVTTCVSSLAADARYDVVRFTEGVVDQALAMHQIGRDNTPLYQFLRVAVNLHHPKGAGPDDPLAYAFDWSLWKRRLDAIQGMCETQLAEVLRSGDLSTYHGHFISLVVDVCHVMPLIHSGLPSEESTQDDVPILSVVSTARKRKSTDYVAQTQKRAKTVHLGDSISTILTEMNPRNSSFWFDYLEAQILLYPSTVKKEYITLVQLVSHLLCDVRSSRALNVLSRCAVLLLDMMPANFPKNTRNSLQFMWSKAAEHLMRSVGKDNMPEHHNILQALIFRSIIQNLEPLLEQYLAGTIAWSQSSVRTLTYVVASGAVKEDKSRLILLQWAFKEPPDEQIADLALSLLLKQFDISHIENQLCHCVTKNDRCCDVFCSGHKPYEVKHPKYCDIFCDLTLKHSPKETKNVSLEKINRLEVNENIADGLQEILTRSAQSILDKLSISPTNISTLKEIFSIIETLIRILSTIWKSEGNLNKELLGLLRNLFHELTTTGASTVKKLNGWPLRRMAKLYQMEVHIELHNLLREPNFTETKFLDMLITVLKEEKNGRRGSYEDHDGNDLLYFTRFDQLIVELSQDNPNLREQFCSDTFFIKEQGRLLDVTGVLSHFLCLPGPLNESHRFLMKELVSSLQNMDSSSPFNLQMVLRVVHMIGSCLDVGVEYLNDILDVLHRVCQQRFTETTVLAMCLAVLHDIVPTIGSLGNDATFVKFTTIMEGFRIVLEKRQQNMKLMVLQFIKVLKVSCSFPTLTNCTWIQNGDYMVDSILGYVTHSSVEICLAASRAVGNVFRAYSENITCQKNALSILHREMINVSGKDDYEHLVVSASSLLALANVFVATKKIRLKVASIILLIIHVRTCRLQLITNFLDLISKKLRVQDASKYFIRHLKHLLTEWLKNGNVLKNFPVQVVNCSSIISFYQKFTRIIGAVVFLLRKEDFLEEMASRLNRTVAQILEEAYPECSCLASQDLQASLSRHISSQTEDNLRCEKIAETIVATLRTSSVDSVPFRESSLHIFFEDSSTVQKVLLFLEEDIVDSVTEEDVEDSLKKYSWLVKKYVDFTSAKPDVNCFVLREAISVILRLLVTEITMEALAEGCDLIKYVVNGYLESMKTEIVLLLPGIVSDLVRNGKEPSLELLRYLVVDLRQTLSEAVMRLDPFPDEDKFKNLEVVNEVVGLKEEMWRFSRVAEHKGRRVGGLTRLRQALETHKEELQSLYQEPKTRSGLSEEQSESLLLRVVQQLVELCSHKDVAVRMEAAKCLGELGPADLRTLVITPELRESIDYIPAEQRVVDALTTLLGQLMQTEGLQVKKAASAALYAVMQYEGNMDVFSNFYAPFIAESTSYLDICATSECGPPLSVWVPSQATDHDTWVQNLSIALLNSTVDTHGVCAKVADVCRVHAAFAHNLLPLLLEVVIMNAPQSLLLEISKNINQLFADQVNGNCQLSLKSVRLMVEAVDHFRRWRYKGGLFESILQVDQLLIAEAAGNCGAHFTSILYAELWFQQQIEQQEDIQNIGIDGVGTRAETLSRVMRSAFARVGVPDGLLGCGTSHLADPVQRVAHLEQMEPWHVSLPLYDSMQNISGLAGSLLQADLLHVLTYIPSDTQVQVTCAAKLGNWALLLPHDAPPSYHLHYYAALKALHKNDVPAVLCEVNRATELVLQHVNDNKVESTRDLYQSLSQLQCLKQLRDVTNHKIDFKSLRDKWQFQDSLKPSEFSLLAEILTMRCVMVKELAEQTPEWTNILGELHIRLIKLARRAKRREVSYRSILELKKMKNLTEDLMLQANIEEARFFWGDNQNENQIGATLLSRLIHQLDGTSKRELQAKCLRMCGNWKVQTKSENPKTIIENYFIKAVKLSDDADSRLESYAAIAKFADANYAQRKQYLAGPDFESRQLNIKDRNSIVSGLQRSVAQVTDRDKRIALHVRTKESAMDQDEVKNLQEESTRFLLLALRYYLLSLQGSGRYDHFVFRLVSLWLNNRADSNVSELLKELLPGVASHKFICLLPQIVPRIAEDILISNTVERALKEHPHHTLPVVFALKNAHADLKYQPGADPKPASRVLVAAAIIKQAANNPKLTQLVREMDQLTQSVIHLANLHPKKKDMQDIPQDSPIMKIKGLHTVMMPVIDLPVRPNLNYENIVGVERFGEKYQLVGGVNAPKKIECIGTNGKKYSLLVKGKDDLRQDAVVQQVFSVINTLLARDEEAAHRRLIMRTYRVVPLSQRSGIIEWCENTQPLGDYLVGRGNSGGAHTRFRRGDITPMQARSFSNELHKSGTSLERKLEGFLMICQRFLPVFHYFFLENFPSAGVCFERRLAYIRSVATSSMVGYVLGLGDRHTFNILIDKASAEVIHIDFGIAFELGRVQMTPETVPFRLTRDIVDGMGLCGVDGVFRVCCERVMAVMRDNIDTITTLLEVLLYDPLYMWTIIPGKSECDSNDDCSSFEWSESDSKVNAMAERALLRLKSRLQGMEQGGAVSTVQGQVNGLIQQARDPQNLCRLFPGWAAYL